MTKTNEKVSITNHLIAGFTIALGGWTLLKIFKTLTSSVAEQFAPEQLKMEATIWVPAIFLFAAYSWWKESKK